MVPPGVPPYLRSLSKEHEIVHLSERFPRNTDDDVWINELAQSGHWNIVTIDLRIASTPHLAAILQQAGHTAFFLTSGWSQLPIEDLSWKFPKAWWQIEKTVSKHVAKGDWFTVGPTNLKPKRYSR